MSDQATTSGPQPVGAGDAGVIGRAAYAAFVAFLAGNLSEGAVNVWKIAEEVRKALTETPQVFTVDERQQATALLAQFDEAKAKQDAQPKASSAKAVAGTQQHQAAQACKEIAEACGCPCDDGDDKPGKVRGAQPAQAVAAINWGGLLALLAKLAQLLPLLA